MVPRPQDDLTDFSSRRVLLIAPEPFFEPRGTPINVAHMCKALTTMGLRLDLATYPQGQDLSLPGLRILRAPRVPGISEVPIGFSWRKVVMDLSLALRVFELLMRNKYDFVHAVEESVFLVLPFSFFGMKVVYDLDSFISDQLRYSGAMKAPWLLRLVRSLERLALKRAVAAITVCQSLTEAALQLNPSARVYQIEDCPLEESLRTPDPDLVDKLREDWGLEERQVVVYTGNLEPYQGLQLLLEGAQQLNASSIPLTIVVVGGSPADIENLKPVVRDLQLDDTVIFVGHRPPGELPEWMALGDVLVSPRTEGENTPLKIYTYMRTGIPIVATDIRSHTQVLDPSTAMLTEPTPDALALGIRQVLSDPEGARQRAAEAKQVAQSRFSFESFKQKLVSAYQEILELTE